MRAGLTPPLFFAWASLRLICIESGVDKFQTPAVRLYMYDRK